jgi:hypothetical protein
MICLRFHQVHAEWRYLRLDSHSCSDDLLRRVPGISNRNHVLQSKEALSASAAAEGGEALYHPTIGS